MYIYSTLTWIQIVRLFFKQQPRYESHSSATHPISYKFYVLNNVQCYIYRIITIFLFYLFSWMLVRGPDELGKYRHIRPSHTLEENGIWHPLWRIPYRTHVRSRWKWKREQATAAGEGSGRLSKDVISETNTLYQWKSFCKFVWENDGDHVSPGVWHWFNLCRSTEKY